VIILTVLLVIYLGCTAAYAWYTPQQDIGTGRRLLAAGGASLVAAAVALLIVAAAADVYGIAVAAARHKVIPVGIDILLAAVVAGPSALVVLGVFAKRGRRAPALAAVSLCLAGYAACLVKLLFVTYPAVDPSAPEILIPATVGLIPVVLLGAGLMRSAPPVPGSSHNASANLA
jgi:hypothetical protein